MYEENLSKNSEIFEKWQNGQTVREISEDTGYPISTVGYYVRKFNRRAQKGEPMDFTPTPEVDKVTLALTARAKINASELMTNYMKNSDYEGLYFFLMDIKLMKELRRDLNLTRAESNILISNLFESMKATINVESNNKSNNSMGKKNVKGKSLDEVLDSMTPD